MDSKTKTIRTILPVKDNSTVVVPQIDLKESYEQPKTIRNVFIFQFFSF